MLVWTCGGKKAWNLREEITSKCQSSDKKRSHRNPYLRMQEREGKLSLVYMNPVLGAWKGSKSPRHLIFIHRFNKRPTAGPLIGLYPFPSQSFIPTTAFIYNPFHFPSELQSALASFSRRSRGVKAQIFEGRKNWEAFYTFTLVLI